MSFFKKNVPNIDSLTEKTSESAKIVAESLKKGSEVTISAASSFIGKTASEAGRLAQVLKENNEKKKLKKLNPLFPEEYFSEDFHCPNLIQIRDDAERRDIEACKGAIGWRETIKGVETLFLYDEAVEMSGLTFVPSAVCNAVYYVDSYNRKRFIHADYLFKYTLNSKLAELEDIAFCLGAKSYSVELSDSEHNAHTSNHSESASVMNAGSASVKQETSSETRQIGKAVAQAEFTSSRDPIAPKLNWFKNNDSIVNLIRNVIDGKNVRHTYNFSFDGSSVATISNQTAAAIDSIANGTSIKASSNISAKAQQEKDSTLIFHIEF